MTDGAGDGLHLARVTLEALSPLSIGSGDSRTEVRKENRSDGTEAEVPLTVAAIQRDANGLPTIPGPGLQGALRRLAKEVYGETFADRMFGHEERGDGNGQAGRVNWGWACVHNASGEAVSGLRLPALDTGDDEILRLLAADEPVWRDHVALSGRHSVDGRRKFARAAAPAGARFSAELSGWGDDGFREDLERIVGLFRHPRLRIGGGSGRGYGRVALRAATCAEAPLADPDATRFVDGCDGKIVTIAGVLAIGRILARERDGCAQIDRIALHLRRRRHRRQRYQPRRQRSAAPPGANHFVPPD